MPIGFLFNESIKFCWRRIPWGIVIVDGKPTDPDPGVKLAHRELAVKSRRIIEDGWVQDSSSQLIQLADLVVHCAFQASERCR